MCPQRRLAELVFGAGISAPAPGSEHRAVVSCTSAGGSLSDTDLAPTAGRGQGLRMDVMGEVEAEETEGSTFSVLLELAK